MHDFSFDLLREQSRRSIARHSDETNNSLLTYSVVIFWLRMFSGIHKREPLQFCVEIVSRILILVCTRVLYAFQQTIVAFQPPHLHLTTSKVMVIVWRLRGNIIRTVLYIANVLPLQWAQLTKTVHTVRLGLEFVFLCFLGCMIYLYGGVYFVLPWSVESFLFMFWRWRNKLK